MSYMIKLIKVELRLAMVQFAIIMSAVVRQMGKWGMEEIYIYIFFICKEKFALN